VLLVDERPMLGRAPDGIIAPSGLLTRPARTKPSTCQHVTGERTSRVASYTQKLWTVLKKKAAYLPGC